MEDLEKIFIKLQLHTPPFTIEEIKYILEEEYGVSMDINEIEKWIELTKEKVEVKKSINRKTTVKSIDSILMELEEIKKILMSKINTNQIDINVVKEVRMLILNLNQLSRELEKRQEETISQFYVPISDIKEYIKKLKKEKVEE